MSDRIRTWTAVAVIGLSLGLVVAVLSGGARSTDRVEALASRLKCPICESQSIADSPAQTARDSYDLIAEYVADGWTDQEIVDFYIATYGPSVLLDPPPTGSGAVLWVAPVAALAVGGLVLARRRAIRARPITPEERRRVQDALEEQS